MPQSQSVTTILKLLDKEVPLSDTLIEGIVKTSLEKATHKQSEHIQELLAEKERLEQEIRHHTHKLQELRHSTFSDIEEALQSCYGKLDSKQINTLTHLQLQSVDILDLLCEIAESAFVAAIENDDNIEASFREIARDLTYKTLRDGYLTLERAKMVVETIIGVAADLAEATPTLSDAILRGSIYGSKKGLTQSITLFKEQFVFLPDQLAPRQIRSMRQTYDELHSTDTLFIQAIHHQADLRETFIKEKMYYILERMRPELSELVNISKETLLLVGEKLSKLGKKAVIKGEKVLHSKAAIGAKRMGHNVWDVAKGAVGGAINSAKDAIDKKHTKK